MTSSVLLKFVDERRVNGKDKVDPVLFFDMVADGEGLRTSRGTGVFNIRGSNDRLDIRRNSFSQRVVNPGRDSGMKNVTQNESPSMMLRDVTIGTVCKITHLSEGNVKVVA